MMRANFHLSFCVMMFSVTSAMALEYTVTDIGIWAEVKSRAYRLNNSGDVVGWSRAIDGSYYVQHALCTAAEPCMTWERLAAIIHRPGT